ncbi:MAG TPA: LD-carboxypeptidase [Casimicrobiaceae bacterium]|nr:LD-carboxypeptidase [Casimicrobiaceae bacterium]
MTASLAFGFFAPSGVMLDAAAVDRATRNLLALGHRVVEDESVRDRHQRFAGDDAARLAAIERIASRDDVDVAMALRGGYGFTRLLDRIDYAALTRKRKRWVGHSDFTAFQLAAWSQARLVTYAGPMASYDLGAAEPSGFTLEHCFAMLTSTEHVVTVALDGPAPRSLEGTLWGGNLAMLVSLLGTRFAPAIDGGILFLEDISEHPYRIERMLYQLLHSGILERQRAILLGAFSDYTLYPHDDGYDIGTVVAHFRERIDVPIYTGLPFGHVRDKLTMPFGGRASLDAGDGRAELVMRTT